jgi:hypothetical protein
MTKVSDMDMEEGSVVVMWKRWLGGLVKQR